MNSISSCKTAIRACFVASGSIVDPHQLPAQSASVIAPQRLPGCCQGGNVPGLLSTALFAAEQSLIAPENLSSNPEGGRRIKDKEGEVYMCQFWMVCRASYIDGEGFAGANLTSGVRFEPKGMVGYPTEAQCLGLYDLAVMRT